MARYDLRVKPSVAKDLRGIPRADVQRILACIESLRDDPRSLVSEQLSGQERYRVRQGTYRVLYSVTGAELLVEIVKVGRRGEVYREKK
jgi:mRNA interferase RelE/StbE